MGRRHQEGLERALRGAAAARVDGLSRQERDARGVVHTPLRLARFMVERAHAMLREAGEPRGLAGDVVVIDPACGPGVFVAAARERGARRVVGLDLDPRPLEDAARILEDAGLGDGVRLLAHDTLAGPAPLDEEESRARWRVVLGNPPWASRSANRDAEYTERRLADFRREPDGAPLAERKLGVLSDDYVRFVRWSAEEARAARCGAIALVTNASFLDGPVHRGMRACLMRWFGRIDIVDLGGSALIARGPERDENLFGVRPGVAVTVAVRGPARRPASDALMPEHALLRRAALRGTREEKLAALESDVPTAPIAPRPPRYAWIAAAAPAPAYDAWPSLPDLMPFHREGVQTNRDAFCVDADRDALVARLREFAERGGPQPGRAHVRTGHYDPEQAREAIAGADLDAAIRRVAYRPHDTRWLAAIPKVCHRPRPALLGAVGRSRFSVLTVRKDRGERPWAHFGATEHVVDNCWLSSRSSCRTRAFPTHRPDGTANVGPPATGWGLEPERLAAYVLGVLAAPCYRERYDARLRADYPRVPPPDASAEAVVAAGEAVRAALSTEPDDGEEVAVGHRVVRSSALARALEAADAAARPALERSGR